MGEEWERERKRKGGKKGERVEGGNEERKGGREE